MTSTALTDLVSQTTALACPLPCGANPRLWFSERPADLELAKASCQACPLRRPCLEGAIERAEPWGVWGGEIFENGMIIESKRPRGRPSGHGERGRADLGRAQDLR